jgi:predicted HTH transcriptional regulator
VERKDDTPQHKAIREAMTNAIIHADFMLNGILKIEKTDDDLYSPTQDCLNCR